MPRIVLPLEELPRRVSEDIGTSDWFTVSQDRINAFAEVTEDRQWIHIDTERAKNESPFGTPIAHGFLTLSLLSHLISETVEISGPIKQAINYGFDRVRFTGPVPSGSRVHARFRVEEVEERKGRSAVTSSYQVAWGVTIEVEGADKPSLVARWIVRYDI